MYMYFVFHNSFSVIMNKPQMIRYGYNISMNIYEHVGFIFQSIVNTHCKKDWLLMTDFQKENYNAKLHFREVFLNTVLDAWKLFFMSQQTSFVAFV